MSDEEVIKRRLLFDGDGTGDDRRLNLLLKMLAKFVNAEDETEEESHAMQEKILQQISLCENSRKRSELLTKSNDDQLDKYRQLHDDYEKKITEIKREIEKQKSELEKAKIIKQNRIQYDLLAKSIAEEPARTETNKKLDCLQTEIKELNNEKKRLEQKLERRRNQFHVLSTSSNQLNILLQEEDSAGGGSVNTSTSLDDITNSPGPEPMSE